MSEVRQKAADALRKSAAFLRTTAQQAQHGQTAQPRINLDEVRRLIREGK